MPDDMVNSRGELTFAEWTRMTYGIVWSAQRPRPWAGKRATADDDPWYDVPPGPPILPDIDDSDFGKHAGHPGG